MCRAKNKAICFQTHFLPEMNTFDSIWRILKMENWTEIKLSFQKTFKIKYGILSKKKPQHSKDNKSTNAMHNYHE